MNLAVIVVTALCFITAGKEAETASTPSEWLMMETSSSSSSGSGPGRTVVPSSRVVVTRKGSLRGLYLAFDASDKTTSSATQSQQQSATFLPAVEMFLGVPYASPPVGSLRFMPPVTVSPWRTVRSADRFGPVCPQRSPLATEGPDGHIRLLNETEALKRMPRGRWETLRKLEPMLTNQSEDCLYLNIFTPYSNSFATGPGSQRPRYPVMVFLHGESYSWGSGNPYDGSVLAAAGKVVVVTLNYRLGVLGFLNPHNDPYSRSISNHGLMDQIAALHWLQENVAEFGGDPTSVTLMGHGTGAACATFLMTSPAVLDGLFQRAILLSGSALSPWGLIQEPNKYSTELSRLLNCSTGTDSGGTAAQLKCLREKSVAALIEAAGKMETPEFLHAFGPSVDGIVVEDEYESSRKKLSHRLGRFDVLFGVTQAESFFALSADDNQYGMEADRRNRLLRTFVRNTYQFHLQEILATIVNEYTDWEKAVLHPINIRDETLEALSDGQYVAPLVKMADLHSPGGQQPQERSSYFYVFEYQTKASEFPQRPGCVHGEELAYIFGAPLVSWLSHFGRNYTKAEVVLSETVMAYWANFARTGNPNDGTSPAEAKQQPAGADKSGTGSRSKSIVEWPPYDQIHRRYLCIGLKPKAKSHYRSHKLAMWTNLIPELHRPSGEADDVSRVHHLLDDFNDPFSYDGKVRVVPATMPPSPTSTTTTQSPMTSAVNSSNPLLVIDPSSRGIKYGAEASSKSGTTNDSRSLATGKDLSGDPSAAGAHFGAYSTALSVTIAIGCSLLILNVLIFAGVYYQRDKQRAELKRRLESGMLSASVSAGMEQHSNHSGAAASSSSRMCDKTDLGNNQSSALLSSSSSSQQAVNITTASVMSSLSSSSPYGASLTQLPPPEFADFPSASAACEAAGNSMVNMGNGRASMISSTGTASFRPVSTLPRRAGGPATATACSNELSMSSSPSSTKYHVVGSLNRKQTTNKKGNNGSSATAMSNVDELRV